MVNRQEDQGQSAIESIQKEGGQDTKVSWIPCDLGNFKNIKEVFTGFRDREDRLDLLALSAGINAAPYDETIDGIDRHFQVNWLGQLYVCNLLYSLLRKTSRLPDTPAPRIVFESSELHRLAPSSTFRSVGEINDSKIDPAQLYARSKLAIILGVKYGLVDRVIRPNNDRIFALSVHPGAVNTAMQQQWKDAYPGLLGKLLTTSMLTIGRNPEQGSCSALYAAISSEIEQKNWNGYYLTNPGQSGKESSQASDPALGEALWELSLQMIREKVGADGIADWNST
ncbi:hypothetical protein UA08_08201 [Talaromyces atroroseus]|uniref:Short-chain dehydrogenase TIC 32, chloroplastic n=1 Tax=Talaromyces atroroseus TaxID=1441469 RepID=A0A225A778_TALAT|nr:hypothetical protein UA08_08201 [Talaromyces atroroseus]OKL56471.1 hypothetical protein UA08_08201 [Talaromyces atroroseus]